MAESIFQTYVEIIGDPSKLYKEWERLKKDSKKNSTELSKAKITFDNSIMKKSVNELLVLQKQLEARFKKQIAMNVDARTLDITRSQLTSVNNALSGVESNAKKTGFSFKSSWVAILGVIGAITASIYALKKGFDLAKEGAQLNVLRSNFQGTSNDIELFRKATAGTVDEASLIKLSNQATDLGISLQDQALLFSLAEDAADKYGTGVEEGMQQVVFASEGNLRGLKALGIQKEIYEKIVKDLAHAQGNEIDKLDAETQKQIRLEAVIRASGITMQQVLNKMPDEADKLDQITVKWKEFGKQAGGALLRVSNYLIDAYNWLFKYGTLIPGIKSLRDLVGSNDVERKPGPGNTLNEWTNAFNNQIKNTDIVAKKTGNTILEIKNKIDDLTKAQEGMVIGSSEYLKNIAEIQRLTKLLEPPKFGFEAEQQKLELQLETAKLLGKSKLEVLETEKKHLTTMLASAKTDEDKLKYTKAINEVTDSIKQSWDEIGASQTMPKGMTAETLFKAITEGQNDIKTKRERQIEAEAESIQEMNDLRIKAIVNEYDQKKAIIDNEYNLEKDKLDKLYYDKGMNEIEYSQAISNLQIAREKELAELTKERFNNALSSANRIGSALKDVFGDNSLINTFMRVLEIAQDIADVMESITVIKTALSFATFGGSDIASAALPKISATPGQGIIAGYNSTVTPSLSKESPVPSINSDPITNQIVAMRNDLRNINLAVQVINKAPGVETQVKRLKKVEQRLINNGVDL